MIKVRSAVKSRWRNRIGLKLFGLLSIVILLALLPFSYLVLEAVNSFGSYSARVNESHIKQQAIDYLLRLSHEQGLKSEEYFNRVTTAATLMSLSAHGVYSQQVLTREKRERSGLKSTNTRKVMSLLLPTMGLASQKRSIHTKVILLACR